VGGDRAGKKGGFSIIWGPGTINLEKTIGTKDKGKIPERRGEKTRVKPSHQGGITWKVREHP